MPTIASYPDVTINASNEVVNTQNVAESITDYLSAPTIGVFGPMPSGLGQLIPTITQKGSMLSRLKKHGHADYIERDSVNDDRYAQPTATRHSRVTAKYEIKDQYWHIPEDSENDSGVNFAESIRQDQDELSTRVEAQSVIEAVSTVQFFGDNGVVLSDDSALAAIPSTLQWDNTTKKVVEGTGHDGVNLNVQKLAECDRIFENGHVPAGKGHIFLTSPNAYRGLTGSDDQSINRDYAEFAMKRGPYGVSAMNMGQTARNYMFIKIGAYPQHKNKAGQMVPQGIKSATAMINSKSVTVEDNYAFCSDVNCISFIDTATAGLSKFVSRIWMQEDRSTLMFRWSAYLGCKVWHPKGVIRVQNVTS